MIRPLLLSALLLGLTACSTNERLLKPDPVAARIVSPEGPGPAKAKPVLDPVCGAKIESGDVFCHTSYRGQEFYFDSPDCKAQFELNPEIFCVDVR